jgi:hypothetical protein
MAAQPENQDNRSLLTRPRIAFVAEARRVDRRAVWVSAITAAGVLSIGAGAIHASAARYQMRISAVYGLTFVAFAIGQIGWGLLASAFPSRPIAVVGAVVNAVVFSTWVITRTAGVPSGPLAGSMLPVGFADAVATTLEGLAVIAAIAAFAAARRRGRDRPSARVAILLATAVVAIPLATLAVLSQAGVIPALPPSL